MIQQINEQLEKDIEAIIKDWLFNTPSSPEQLKLQIYHFIKARDIKKQLYEK